MSNIEKTIFISYRRTNIGFALAVYQNLSQYGYDVFLDYTGIDSGNFEQIIIENIKSRAHFIVVLTPSALERVHEPDDWLRREIETAIDLKRNIIPMTFENFDWKLAKEKYLTAKLAALAGYNELSVPIPYFMEAMERLRNRYLNIALDLVLHPVSIEVEQATEVQQQEADSQPTVSETTLTAEEWFEQGYQYVENDNHTQAIKAFTEAIRLKPHFAQAFNNRGILKIVQGDHTGALRDFNEAIHFMPDDAAGYNNRGLIKQYQGEHRKAIEDFSEAIRLMPDYVSAYNNRGNAKRHQGDTTGAIEDYNEAIRLEPSSAFAYSNRGEAYFALGQYNDAQTDFQKANELQPGLNFAIGGLAVTLHKLGDIEQAIKLWKMLVELEEQHTSYDLLTEKWGWPAAMREEARQLVAKL